MYRHFYITHMHILSGRNSTSCTFVGEESHRRDAYTKGEKISFFFFHSFLLTHLSIRDKKGESILECIVISI